MRIWMRITSDKFQFPEVIADTVEELSELTGVKIASIRSMASRVVHGRLKTGTFIYVDIDDEEVSK